MENQKTLERYVEINSLMKELENEKKEIQTFLIDEAWFENWETENFKVHKTIRKTTIIKEWMEAEFEAKFWKYVIPTLKMDKKEANKIMADLLFDYPDAFNISNDIDLKVAEKDTATHDYLDQKITEYLTCKAKK